MLSEQYYIHEMGAMKFYSEAETAEALLLLMWKQIAPASEGWSNAFLREAIKDVQEMLENR